MSKPRGLDDRLQSQSDGTVSMLIDINCGGRLSSNHGHTVAEDGEVFRGQNSAFDQPLAGEVARQSNVRRKRRTAMVMAISIRPASIIVSSCRSPSVDPLSMIERTMRR